MRHRKSGRKLNRTNAHRKALMRNMARALLTYERIRTTEAKAKELRKVVDSLVTMALRDDLHSRRLAYKALNSHQIVQRLFDEIAPRFKEAKGGYTRILKLALPRRGDCAPMVVIELTAQAEAPAVEEKPAKVSPKAEKKAETAPAAEAPAKEASKPEAPAAE